MAILKESGRKFFLALTVLGLIFTIGILKHFLSGIPSDAMITGNLTALGLYFGINWAQKNTEAKHVQETNCEIK